MAVNLNEFIIEIIALLFVMAGWYIMISLFQTSSRRQDKLTAAIAFGIAISAYTITLSLPKLAANNSALNTSLIFYSVFIPVLCATIAIYVRQASIFLQSVLLALGIVGSHITLIQGIVWPQIIMLLTTTTALIWFALTLLTSPFFRLASCSHNCRQGLSIVIVSIGLVLLSYLPSSEFQAHENGQQNVENVYALLAAAALLLLYMQLVVSIKKEQLSLWRVLSAIVAAEFGIMFLLPPLLGNNGSEGLAALLDGSLLSIFVFPLLFQQHRTSMRLAISHSEIQTTLLAIKDGVIVCDEKGHIRYFNRSAEGLTGQTCDDVLGQEIEHVLHLSHEMNQQSITNPVTRCLKEHTVIELANHTVIKHSNGSMTPIEHSASPIFDPQGQLAGAIVILRDVTERRQRQREQVQEQELHLLLNSLLSLDLNALTIKQLLQTSLEKVLTLSWLPAQKKGGIFLTEDNDHLRLVAQLGLSDEVCHHCALIDFNHCLCGQAALSQATIYKSCLDPDHEFQHEGMHNHGHYCIPLLSENETLGVILFYLDEDQGYNTEELDILMTISHVITHLVEKKKALKKMALSHKVIQNSHQGVMVTNADNKIISINPAFTDITGYTLEEVKGLSPKILASGRHDADFYHDLWSRLIDSGVWQGEIWNKTKAGDIYPEWLRITTIKDSSNNILHYIALFSDLSKIKKAEENITQLAYFDTLTGLPNRSQLNNLLAQAISNAQRNDLYIAILFMDLDRFKGINDTLGHLVGDSVLEIIGKRLQNNLREGDIAARWGGDEFIILVQSHSAATIRKEAHHVAEKIQTTIRKPIRSHNSLFNLDISIGISIYPDDATEADSLLQFADATMYQVKQHGSGNYQFFSTEINEKLQRQRMIEQALKHAISNNEFELYYQAKIHIKTKDVVGFEALLRWTSAELGSVSPAEFIPIAEETSLIIDIDNWVFEQVCQQIQFWHSIGLCQHGEHIAVNIASRHLQSPQFVNQITSLVQQHAIPPKSIQIEITETGLMEYAEEVIDHLQQLKEAGFSIAIDDFGTGYSSLARLKNFPIDLLKIDQSFIRDITHDEDDKAIVLATIKMAKALGMAVCAEGVEEQEHADILASFDCTYAQGYFYARPEPAREAERHFQINLD